MPRQVDLDHFTTGILIALQDADAKNFDHTAAMLAELVIEYHCRPCRGSPCAECNCALADYLLAIPSKSEK